MIVPMARVDVVGPRAALPRALAVLQDAGVIDLRAPALGARGGAEESGGERLRAQRARLAGLAEALTAAPAASVPPPAGPGSPELDAWLDRLEGELAAIEARRAALVAERADVAQRVAIVSAVAPLHHDLPADQAPELYALLLEDDAASLALLEGEVRALAGGSFALQARPLPDGRMGVLLVIPRARSRALAELLGGRGVRALPPPAGCTGGRVVDVLLWLARREVALPAELAAEDARRADLLARSAAPVAAAAAAVDAALGRAEASERCGGTAHAFVLSGYVPVDRVAALRARAEAELGPGVAVLTRPPKRAEWPDVPVVLRNRPAVRPFERLLGLVPLPRYGSLDPTPWLALTFPLFLGLVLGDLALGAAGAVAALAVRRGAAPGSARRDFATVALACAACAAAFGLLFGEALGELGAHLGLRPLVLDRRRALTAFLGLTVAVGVAHVALGAGLGVVAALRGGARREALARAARLALLCAGAVAGAAQAGLLRAGARDPALAAAGVALAVAIAAEGPLATLELALGLGNVLSYTRLMALGLASVMLAEVANRLATSLRPLAAGLALGALLHAVNFTLGLLSPSIAALRLHYVEFFERFYEAGGTPYRPFARAGT